MRANPMNKTQTKAVKASAPETRKKQIERVKEWRAWVKANKTNEMVWPFNAWQQAIEGKEEKEILKELWRENDERLSAPCQICMNEPQEVGDKCAKCEAEIKEQLADLGVGLTPSEHVERQLAKFFQQS